MSLFNKNNIKVKKFIYPKEPKKMKSPESSSKSTRSTSKNIFSIQSQKLLEKIEYHDLYSDLINSRQEEKLIFQKKYPKEENEDSLNDSSLDFSKFKIKKNKKSFTHKKVKINYIKYFKEDGKIENFPLYRENDIKINEYDGQVKIESAEDDFESDESTLDYGKKKVENDLIEAFAMIKKENINCLVNYKKYAKLFKKPRKKLDLKKNLPHIPTKEKKK